MVLLFFRGKKKNPRAPIVFFFFGFFCGVWNFLKGGGLLFPFLKNFFCQKKKTLKRSKGGGGGRGFLKSFLGVFIFPVFF